jgi:ribonucleoside-diphosphate reductase alpha chain
MTLTAPEDVAFTLKARDHESDYISLNAQLNLWAPGDGGDRKVQYNKDREAVRQYFLNHVNPNTQWFHNLEEKLKYLIENEYYEKEFFDKYDPEFVKKLFKRVYDYKFRFPTFIGAYKFYTSYSMKTFDGKRYLERFEDRVAITALYLADGDTKFAEKLADEVISGRFQPATPTFLNSGKAQRGDLVSCFLLNIEDDLNSIMRAVNSAGQLSKRGGGVALNLTNIRAKSDPIKKIENQSSGVVPVMKILEDVFSYANQLGARQGAGAVYLNAHHMDIMDFLDTKRENADEKVRIKTLSLGVVIPDITFELARANEPMYLFSPYDIQKVYGKEFAWVNVSEIYREAVDNPDIRKKKIDPRQFLSTLAEIQMESGYPYIVFEDAVNRANNVPGKITMSNLCSEILQPQLPSMINDDQTYAELGKDISCNLGSLNIRKALESPNFAQTVEVAIRTLTQVSDFSDIEAVPTVRNGNKKSHAIGLGAMNLHGAFAHHHMYYGDNESLDLTNIYFLVTTYHALRTSNLIAKERGVTFDGFDESKYATGEYFDRYINDTTGMFAPRTDKVRNIFAENNIHIPTVEDWVELAKKVKKHGLYNQNLQAVPPTGSISYINHSVASILPATDAIVEARKEGKIGTVYSPNADVEGNEEYFIGLDMFSIDPKKIIDVYSIAQYYVDQGLSLTLGYKSSATTRTLTSSYLYAFSKGKASNKELDARGVELAQYPQANIKTMYYARIQNENLEAINSNECVSCAL